MMRFSQSASVPGADSPLHRFDARIKLISALLLLIGILFTPERAFPAYPLIWALIASVGLIGGVHPVRLARHSAIALPFALMGLTLLFTVPGQPLIAVGSIMISDAGAARFAGILLKTLLAAQVSILLMLTTPFTDLLWALEQLRIPAPLVQITALLYRYLFTLKEEGARLNAARAARSASAAGKRAGGTLRWRAQVAGSIIGSLFLRSMERSERVYAAMAARGFTRGFTRGQRSSAPIRWQSVLIGLLPVAVLAVIQVLARVWWSR